MRKLIVPLHQSEQRRRRRYVYLIVSEYVRCAVAVAVLEIIDRDGGRLERHHCEAVSVDAVG